MSIFNKAQIEAMMTGRYICSECGETMIFETPQEDILVCEHCGHSVDIDHYGFENEQDYQAMYPTKEDLDD